MRFLLSLLIIICLLFSLTNGNELNVNEKSLVAIGHPRVTPVGPNIKCNSAHQDGSSSHYHNPVTCTPGADPSILAEDGVFYLYTTGCWVRKSTDLFNWDSYHSALVKPKWCGADAWAPHVIKIKGKHIMYFAGDYNPPGGCSNSPCFAIGVAVSTTGPMGPFHGQPQMLATGQGIEAIDPFVTFYGKNPRLWYGSGTYGIRTVALTTDGLHVIGSNAASSHSVVLPTIPGDSVGQLFEGSWVHPRNGYYYLFVSGPGYNYDYNYQVTVFRSKSAISGFSNTQGRTVVYGSSSYVSPGHNAILSVKCNGKDVDYLVYHGYLRNSSGGGARYIFFSKITWDSEGWPTIDKSQPQTQNSQICVNQHHGKAPSKKSKKKHY